MTPGQRRAIALAKARLRVQGTQTEGWSPYTPSGERTGDTADITTPELIAGNPAARFAKGAAGFAMGGAQLINKGLGELGVPEAYQLELGKLHERIDPLTQRGRQAYPGTGTEGLDVAELAGSVLSPASLAAMKIAPAASVLGRSAQGTAIGGTFGAAAPVSDDANYASTKAAQIGSGMLIGGLLPPAIDAAKLGYRVSRNLIDPILPGGTDRAAARLLTEAAGPKRAAIEAELAKNTQFVRGSQPTAAEAAAPAGSPGFSALQRFAENRTPDAYADIAARQAGARQEAIREFGQTPLELKAAELTRARTAAQNYGTSAKDVIVPTGSKISSLLERPSISEALKRARSLVEERGGQFGSTKSGYTVADMQAVKMALDDIVKDPKTFGIGASEANAIQKTRGEFINWLSKESPKWEMARRVYATQSKPINEMQVGQELEKALTKPIGVGERPTVFAGAMQEAPRTLKRATGQPRFEELDEVLSPENLSKAKGVLADLSRKAEQQRLAGLGASKISELEKPFGLPATGPLHQGYMVFKTILGRVSKGITDKTLDDIADALQVPSATLKLMQKVPDPQKQQMIDALITQKLGRGAIVAGTAAASQSAQ